jgi:spoIIIJ-associated protein
VRVRLIGEADEPAAAAADGAEGEASEPVEDEAEFAAQMLDKLLELMGIEADVSIRDAETPGDGLGMAAAVLDVEGDDLGILIGRRGETLASLQYLLNLMVSRQLGDRHQMFTIDVEGYRRRRERQLTTLALRMADQVRRTRRPVTLEPMPPSERRIIHIALAEDRQVETGSIGEGEDRKVSITLKQGAGPRA